MLIENGHLHSTEKSINKFLKANTLNSEN